MNEYELAKAQQAYSPPTLEEIIKQQADRIAELEKQGEPVAWMQMHHKDNIPTKFSPVKVWEDDIPLYTTPQTKPLSDEEIEEVIRKHWNKEYKNRGMMAFAKAILRKAQEK